MADVAHRVVELEDLWGARAPALSERLLESPSLGRRFAILAQALWRRARPEPTGAALVAYEQLRRAACPSGPSAARWA